MCKEFLQVNERTCISKTGQTFLGSCKSGKFCTSFYVLLATGGIWANWMNLRSFALEIYFNMEFSYLTKISFTILMTHNPSEHTGELYSNHCACLVSQSCPTLGDTVDCSPPGSSVHGASPGKDTGGGCHAPVQGSSQPRGWTQVSRITGRFFTVWATREVHNNHYFLWFLIW